MVDCVFCLATYSREVAKKNRGSLLVDLATLQVLHQYPFELPNGVVMNLDQIGEISYIATNVEVSEGIWDRRESSYLDQTEAPSGRA